MEETREQRREREDREEKFLARLVFEACQKLDDSLVLREEDREIFLIKKAGKDTVTASLSRRGMGSMGGWGEGWAAIEFGTSVFEVNPKNWYRLISESYVSRETRDKHQSALPGKIVKVLNDVASAVKNFRANEALKKRDDESKIEAVKKVLSGSAKVVQGFGSRAEVTLPLSGKQYRVERTYDGNFDVWVGTARVNGKQLVELMEFLDKHAIR